MEKKLTIKVSQRINAIMNIMDKALINKYGSDKEFYGILIAQKENPWMCEDIIIPKQKVTSSSITIPKEGMYAPYQKCFEDYIVNNKTQVVVGTIHSHNSMDCFFSGGDDEDLDNNACFNLNEGLPFIDIVWSNKDNSYKGRVRLKIGKGESKQIFTHEGSECVVVADQYTKTMIQKFKEMVSGEYKIDEEIMSKSLLPKITEGDVKEYLGRIEIEQYGGYYKYNEYKPSSAVTYRGGQLSKGGDIQIEIGDYNESEKVLLLTCTGKDKEVTDFMDMVEDGLGQWYDRRMTSFLGNEMSSELRCDSKKRYKKMKNRIEFIYKKFQENGKKLESKVNDVQTKVPIMSDEELYESSYGGYGEPSYYD